MTNALMKNVSLEEILSEGLEAEYDEDSYEGAEVAEEYLGHSLMVLEDLERIHDVVETMDAPTPVEEELIQLSVGALVRDIEPIDAGTIALEDEGSGILGFIKRMINAVRDFIAKVFNKVLSLLGFQSSGGSSGSGEDGPGSATKAVKVLNSFEKAQESLTQLSGRVKHDDIEISRKDLVDEYNLLNRPLNKAMETNSSLLAFMVEYVDHFSKFSATIRSSVDGLLKDPTNVDRTAIMEDVRELNDTVTKAFKRKSLVEKVTLFGSIIRVGRVDLSSKGRLFEISRVSMIDTETQSKGTDTSYKLSIFEGNQLLSSDNVSVLLTMPDTLKRMDQNLKDYVKNMQSVDKDLKTLGNNLKDDTDLDKGVMDNLRLLSGLVTGLSSHLGKIASIRTLLNKENERLIRFINASIKEAEKKQQKS